MLPSFFHKAAAAILFAALFTFTAGCDNQAADDTTDAQMTPLTSFDPQVQEVLDQMTLAEKIGQMTQADQEFLQDPSHIQEYFLGSLLSGGSSDPDAGNSVENWTDLYNRYQEQALQTRLGIPLIYGIDAVHGHSNVVGAVIFPHNIGLGATRNPDLVRQIGSITAEEVQATGIQWTFAPAVSVPRNIRWGRTYEGFSEDPELVTELGVASIRGLQGSDLSAPLTVAACAKHYAGDGGTVPGTGLNPEQEGLDQGDVQVDSATFWRVHMSPYEPAVDAGVATIMPSYSSWQGEKMSAHEQLLTGVLKNDWGFEGFLISDYRAVDQVHPDYKTAIELSINAGMDMVMVPDRYQEFIQLLTELVEEERVPMSRIDDAVTRILRVKFALGMMEEDAQLMADGSLHDQVGSPEHREVARDAVRQSLVLLKNEENALPLSRDATRIHVAGTAADDIGIQSGGWTIDWQGGTGEITEGTTILEAIRQAVPNAEVTFAADGGDPSGADAVVVVIGEEPYAEMQGDRQDLSLGSDDVALVRRMSGTDVPVITVLISGRPLLIQDALENSDAFVAAWLPGTEGTGVADVLFGDYAPTGKLSYTWPRSMDQVPINVGDEPYDPLFEFGYGLTYE